MTKELRIFEIRVNSEKEWFADYFLLGALKQYLSLHDESINEFEEGDSIEELPREKWATHKVYNSEYDPDDPEDVESETFEEVIKRMKSPDIIAGTVY